MSGAIRSFLGSIVAALVSISVLSYVLALGIGLYVITSTQLGSELLNITVYLPIGALLLFIPTFPINLLVLVDACIIIFGLCFWYAFKGKGGFLAGLRSISTGSKPGGVPNWLVVMPLLGSALLLVVIILTGILDRVGLPTGSLNVENPALFFAGLTYAPIEEEMAFRISILGLLVGIRAAWKSRLLLVDGSRPSITRIVFSALVSPERAKEESGLSTIEKNGWRGLHWTEWTLLVITSVAFGLAHSLSGSGWGPGKAVTAGLPGFVLGLVYLAYGPYANILLHWLFNFYLYVFSIDTAFIWVLFATSLLTFAMGALAFLVGIAWLIEKRPVTLSPPTPYMPQ